MPIEIFAVNMFIMRKQHMDAMHMRYDGIL